MNIFNDTNIEVIAKQFINDVLSKDNFDFSSSAKGNFLTGSTIIICESKGLQEYLQLTCTAEHGIWAALSFKPLAGFLMQCAYNLSKKKKDESENVFNQHNLLWAIYNLLNGKEKTYFFANELASLFFAYQIYRPKLIKKWNKNERYIIKNADVNFIKNEEFQRNIWYKLKKEFKNEQDITELYDLFENSEKKIFPKNIFIFCPISMPQIQLESLKYIANAGCNVNLYLHQISCEYIGDTKSEKSIAYLRKLSWNNKIAGDKKLYWDIGNRLIANLGRSAQVLFEQIGWENLNYTYNSKNTKTLLENVQEKIQKDNNEYVKCKPDASVTINNCFSPLREIEVLCDYLLDIFENNKDIGPADIAVVTPNIENYVQAIDSVFSRHNFPYTIADRNVKNSDKTAQLLKLLFSIIESRYEAPDVMALYEYSLFVQNKKLEKNDRDFLEKWIKDNAIRRGLEPKNKENPPNYSFKTGFDQLYAGFFIISDNDFSENGGYCFPDIEGNQAKILGDFVYLIKSLINIEKEIKNDKTVEDWDYFLRENLQAFFGSDEVSLNEDYESPYQKIIGAWDSLKKEILTGFGSALRLDFSVINTALLNKMEEYSKYSYTNSGRLSFSNIETIRAAPHKVICFIGMNNKEFPRQSTTREMSLMGDYIIGDKDISNEDRLMFLETICSTKQYLYISFIGQNEKTAEELLPSSALGMLLKNLNEQFGIEEKDIIKKHPLQPFSVKYFTGQFKTYDKRWDTNESLNTYKNIWEWVVKNDNNQDTDNKENRSIDDLYRCLNDVPKYFINEVCNIDLPYDTKPLEGLEPFIVESGLEKWKLADTVIKHYKNEKYKHEIEVQKRRGELPSGRYADVLINKTIGEIEILLQEAKKERENTFFIYPSNDKGKYRLKHWLYHMEYNLKVQENQNTKMFLKGEKTVKSKKVFTPVIIELAGMSKEKAEKILENLWNIKSELNVKLIPVFPDAAWIYITKGDMTQVNKNIFGRGENDHSIVQYSKYADFVFGDAESFNDFNMELEELFIFYTKKLFNEYNNYLKAV